MPIGTVTMTVRLLPLIWIDLPCAYASPIIPKIDAASAMAKAITRSRSQLPCFVALSEVCQLKPALISLCLFTTHSPPLD
ncbi:MAG: hypothetical protein ACM3Z4_13140 [Hyphomicrobiales bacterium]